MKNYFFLFLPLFSTTILCQTTIVIQPDGTAGKDVKVFSLNSFQNFGSDLDIIAATWTFSGDPGTLRSMIQFDLSSIPAGAGILEAKLSLYYNFVTGSEGQSGHNASFLRRITEDWNENTVNWNTQPSFTNTNQVHLSESTLPDQDYENINVTSLIRDMLADRAHSFGFLLIGENEQILSSMKFFSSDASQASQRPKLEITYTTNPVDCITIQPGSEGKDAKIFSLNPGINFGNDLDFIAAAWTFSGNTGILRSFIDFDLTVIPPQVEVVSASLSLYYNDVTSSAGQQGSNNSILQRVTDLWNEQNINWNNQPATTNVNEVLLPTSTSMNEDYTGINVTNLVTDMIANPGSSYGFMIRQSTENILRSMKFASSDVDDSAKHPKLEICYTLNTSNKEIYLHKTNILPNPFENYFLVQGLHGNYDITITDLDGKVVYVNKIECFGNNTIVPNLERLTSGVYFIKATGENGNYYGKAIKATRF